MSTTVTTSPALDNLATSLNTLYNQMEKCYVTICEKMGAAREYFEDDDEFWGWVDDYTDFKRRTANEYLQVQRNVLERRSADETVKSIPFNVLRELSRANLPKSTQNKVIKDFTKAAQKDTKKPTLEDVKVDVRKALGKPPKKVVALLRKKTFAERLAYADGTDVSAWWLFDLPENYCPETASILVKYWKQKYHPDRDDGDAYLFTLLTEKADALELR